MQTQKIYIAMLDSNDAFVNASFEREQVINEWDGQESIKLIEMDISIPESIAESICSEYKK